MSDKNLSLEALKSHLFEALEGVKNLSDDMADPCEKTSIEQARQIVDIAEAVIDIYKVQVDAMRVFSSMDNVASAPQLMINMGVAADEDMKELK